MASGPEVCETGNRHRRSLVPPSPDRPTAVDGGADFPTTNESKVDMRTTEWTIRLCGRGTRTYVVFAAAILSVASCATSPPDPELTARTAAALQVAVAVNAIGRLTSSGTGAMRTYNQYDALGRTTAAQH